MLSWSRQNPKSCQAHLKLLLFAGQVCLEGVYVVEMGAAFLVVVFLVMLAFHHFLISLTQLLLLQNRRTREYFLSPGMAAFIGSVWRCWMKSIYAILFFFPPETRLLSLLSFYLFYIGLLGGCVDLLFVLPVLLLCLVIQGLMLSHLSSPLFIIDTLGWDLCNDLLEIFLLWWQGDSSMSREASVFAECIRRTEINKNVVRS